MLDHVPGLFTSTMPAIVRPRKTSSDTRRPLGLAANTLGDILSLSLFECYVDLKVLCGRVLTVECL